MAFAIFADAPVDVAVVEVGLGGEWDATNVVDGAVAVVDPDRPGPHAVPWRHRRVHRDGEGRDHQARRGGDPRPAAAGGRRGAAAPGRGGRGSVAREGLEFGVLQREVAVGGQLLTLQGLGGMYDEVFLPLYGAHQAENAACALAAVEAFFGAAAAAQRAGRPRSRPLDAELVRRPFAAVRSPGPAGGASAQPRPCSSTPRTTRPGWRPRAGRGDRGVQLPPPGRRRRGQRGQGRARDARASSSPARRAGGHGATPRRVDGRRRARRARRDDLRGRPGARRAPGWTTPSRSAVGLADETPDTACPAAGGARHRIGGHGRRGPAAAGRRPGPATRRHPAAAGRALVHGGRSVMKSSASGPATQPQKADPAAAMCQRPGVARPSC